MNTVVVGAAGYAGGELLRLLRDHPAIGALGAHSRSSAGRPWPAVHPQFLDEDRLFVGGEVEEAVKGADIVFLAMPHGESSHRVPALLKAAPGALFVDLAGDFRLRDEVMHETYYGKHPDFSLNGTFTYAFPEGEREAIKGARRLSCPGCFATGSLMALVGLAGTGALRGAVVAFAVTGSSGSGTLPKPGAHHPRRNANMRAYKLFSHQHQPEVREQLIRMGEQGDYRLTTLSGPFVRGIFTTIHTGLDAAWDSERVEETLKAFESKNPFYHLVEGSPDLTPILGTNHVLVGHAVHEGEIILMSAIDNLVKGAAGQAVQAMNLALGLKEDLGLEAVGLNPY